MNSSNQKLILQNCPYLGLHDDQRTSLAYPSAWNYCYRAHPPASVSISHQIAACLNPEYIHCPVYLAVQDGTLPANIRGSSSTTAQRRKSARRKSRRIAWSVLIIILLIMAVVGVQRLFPGYFQTLFSLTAAPSLDNSSLTSAVVRVDSTNPAKDGLISSLTATPSPPRSLLTATIVPLNTGTPTQKISLTSPGFTPIIKRCGYTLDTPFGVDNKFTLHQIASGENLDKLSVQYQTTVDAIRAVNYSMPVPVWENWIVVIPVGVSDVKGLPAFEPYLADGKIFSLEELAQELSADAQSLSKYNAFTDACTVFRGWLIVPRTPKTASD
jgi:hypothetical protein